MQPAGTTLTDAAYVFSADDIGKEISGKGIPDGSVIADGDEMSELQTGL